MDSASEMLWVGGMNLLGEPANVGRFCGSNVYDVTPEAVSFYAEALDDDSLVGAPFAPPLLHHSECYNFLGHWYLKNLCLLYTSPSPRDVEESRMPSSA